MIICSDGLIMQRPSESACLFIQQLGDDAVDFCLLALSSLKIRVGTKAGNRVLGRADEQGNVIDVVFAALSVVTQIITTLRLIQAFAVGCYIYGFAADAVFGQRLGNLSVERWVGFFGVFQDAEVADAA